MSALPAQKSVCLQWFPDTRTCSLMVFLCLIFGAAANQVGVKWILVLGTLGYAPYSASLYVNNRYGVEWFVIFGGATCGIAAAALWSSEAAIALGYAGVGERGRFSESESASVMFKNDGDINDSDEPQLEYGLGSVNSASSSAPPFSSDTTRKTVIAARSRIRRTTFSSHCSVLAYHWRCWYRPRTRSFVLMVKASPARRVARAWDWNFASCGPCSRDVRSIYWSQF